MQIKDKCFSCVVQICRYIHSCLQFHKKFLEFFLMESLTKSLAFRKNTQWITIYHSKPARLERERDYFIAIVAVKQRETKTTSSSPATPAAPRIRHQC
jgi:hypothetical protein